MTIFINGNILTLNEQKIAQAFSIKEGFFNMVGSNDEILKHAEDSEEIIDLKGKTIIPGFNDCHMHFLGYAVTKDNVQLQNVESIEKMISLTKEYIGSRNIEKEKWIISRGWNDNLFTEKRLPNRYDLDKISTEHPIFFARVCGHIGVANSKALELLNITSSTSNPSGGVIDKEAGEPTGILRENALNIVYNSIPPMTKDEIKRVLSKAFEDALRVGITTIQTEDIGQAGQIKSLIDGYKELENEGKLPVRIILQCALPTEEKINEAIDLNLKTGKGSNLFKIGPVKLFEDGSLGGRTAAMREPYSDRDSEGVLIYDEDTLNDLTKKIYDSGFQIAIHAIGDKAVEIILNSYEEIYNENKDEDLRFSIIHCQFTDDSLLNRFKDMNVIANVQPSFVMTDYPIVEKAVGETRANSSYAWKDMLEKGIHTAFSSDAPIESFNPIEGIYAAVTRKDLKGNPSSGWHSEQCISVEEALKCYTIEPAYANFEENIKGTIAEGKLADFVVLSEDITTISPEDIKSIKVLQTYVGGIQRY